MFFANLSRNVVIWKSVPFERTEEFNEDGHWSEMATKLKVHQCTSFENFVVVLPSLVICSSIFVHPLLFKDLASMHSQNIFSLLCSSRECFSQMKISRIYISRSDNLWESTEVKKIWKITFDVCNKIFKILFSFFFFRFVRIQFHRSVEDHGKLIKRFLKMANRVQLVLLRYNLYRCVCFVSPLKRPSSCSINFTRRVMRFPAVSGIHLSGICLVGLARLALNSRPCHGVTISVI